MSSIKLSICIPTYNRAKYLEENLDFLIPQVINNENVEVIIIDNASIDNTEELVKDYLSKCDRIKYYRNEFNLGYAGNQVKCLEYAGGEYCAILSDDDIYLEGEVDLILKHIEENTYVFLALNYYGFINDPHKPHRSDFAPAKDIIFERAYDIMNYPSVGHFSGFIFNTQLAKETLSKILMDRAIDYYEKYRGIINDLAVRTTLSSKLPSCFIGERRLANRFPDRIDYDLIYHLCLDVYEYYKKLYDEGLINRDDIKYRSKIVLGLLPRAIIIDTPYMSRDEIKKIKEKFKLLFHNNLRFLLSCLPLIYLAKNDLVKNFYVFIYKQKKRLFN